MKTKCNCPVGMEYAQEGPRPNYNPNPRGLLYPCSHRISASVCHDRSPQFPWLYDSSYI